MKKLMIALAVVALATASQAANWKWKTSSTGTIYAMDTTTPITETMAYIFADGQQSTVFDNWKGGKELGYNKSYDPQDPTKGPVSYTLDSKNTAGGLLNAPDGNAEFSTEGSTGKQSFFVALIDDKGDLFISSTKSGNVATTDGGTILTFSTFKTDSGNVYKNATAYGNAGWYAASVPEPTSGLLLVLGMAGLALRRRRA